MALSENQKSDLFKILQLVLLFVISFFEVKTSNTQTQINHKQDEIVARLDGNKVANESIAQAVKQQTAQMASGAFGPALPMMNRRPSVVIPPSPDKKAEGK